MDGLKWEQAPPPPSNEFLQLRERYHSLMAMQIGEPMEIELWLQWLARLFQDTKAAGYMIQEIARPRQQTGGSSHDRHNN